ncbi:hypothetical protein R5R35_014253 [Gryllus longicercus]|uniref:Integrin beta n=1 Tax=Gryllus longicercus TaxID=2509291 RepID=A0AAN9ZGE3_9ORTH
MKRVWLGLVLCVWSGLANSAEEGGCASHNTCNACITAPHCQWCSSHVIGRSKCVHNEQTKTEGWCDGTPVVMNSSYRPTHAGTEHSWLLPERVKINLRVREEVKFNITYRRLDDYPVDLYYLMDLSNSMRDDKENLSKLGDKLAAVMKNITRNFRLGFGSFVDKVAMPFVNTHPTKLAAPCPDCVQPYSFKNHMPLTTDTDLFSKMVDQTPVSGNVDHPEGGFDALMQAMVCTKEIAWREHARHLLVMATDATFHMAGDGKLAGVVEPNDETCHMEKGEYTHGLIYDYPTVAQLNRQAQNKSITLIFAVIKELEKVYQSLVDNIKGSAMGTLSADSMNVIELVQGVYEKLVESVQMTDNSESKDVSVSYRSRCIGDSGELHGTDTCPQIHARENVTFEVSVIVPKCPPNAGEIWNETITISPNGIVENMVIDLQVYCGCPCEQEGSPGYEKNSSSCQNHGDKKCGMCSCYGDYTGQKCECASDQFTKKESVDACIANDTGLMCSNRGSCICNVCNCTRRQNPEEHVYGTYCECDNFSCVRFEGKICGGPERGHCDCGKCICNPGWKNEDCSCRDTVHTCRSLENPKELCSGAGDCHCGSCKCHKGHSGQFCEDCMTCPDGRCKSIARCVEYLAYNIEEYDKELCDPKNITIVERKKHIKEDERVGREKFCRHPDDSGCSFVFTYEEFDTGFIIVVEEEKQCPAAVDLLGIIFGVIGGTVLIGLLSILIWKLLTTVHDRREFAKFEKERLQSKWERGDNPLFVQATSTFSNPTFSGN